MSEIKVLRGKALHAALVRLKPADMTEADWADRAGINKGFFSNLKAQEISPRSDTLRKLLGAIGRSEADLYATQPLPRAEMLPTTTADAGETVGIQKLDLSLSMGPGTVIGDYVEAEKVELDLALVRSITRAPTDRLRLVTGHGHSMEPTLQGNDMILIDTTDRLLARQDAIYWIDLFGAAGLKRLRTVAKDRVLIISDNPAVDNQEVAAEDLRIDGRAIWFARGL